MIKQMLIFTAVFLLGVAAASIIPAIALQTTDLQLPENNTGGYEYKASGYLDRVFGNLADSSEKSSPKERITEDHILVMKDKVQININDAQWATFTDTNSMDPVIDAGSYAIEVTPKSEDDLSVGDIAAYSSDFADGTIIHRIVHIGNDEQGKYFVLKGDNNPTSDPGRVRFSQIKSVVVAIIY
jgi:hypothetical protein